MSISKQIGWSNESNLLWDILNQINRLTEVISQGGGGGGSGTVTSVTGTANRVDVTGTPTVAPIIDISSTYVGQSSITTVGTLTGGSTGAGFTVALGTSTITGVLSIANGGTGSSTNTAWLLASGGTLTGANTITGTTVNTLKFVFDSLAVTQVNGAGHWLSNTTVAAAGAQQISPSTVWEGQGWKTTATAGSQSVYFTADVLPVQGTTSPSGTWRLRSFVNGSIITSPITLSSDGLMTIIGNAGITSATNINYNCSATTGNGHVFAMSHVSTSGNNRNILLSGTFTAPSGTGVFEAFRNAHTINQSGGANGQVTIFLGVPTITAAVDVTGYDWNPITPANITGVHLAARFVTGSVLLGDTAKTANTGVKVFVLSNASTNATAAQTNGIVIHAKDASTGSANSTLALYLEEAPEASVSFTQSHRLKVWINNVEYYLSLDAV